MTTSAHSVAEFCRAHGISRAHFYNLMKRGLAPKTLVVGRRRLVADESAAAWRRSMEQSTDARSNAGGERS
jgi:predicted DNA-binding transcriptional regulator AlpA